MKLKIIIAGSQVHDVGYRYWLMSNAIDLGLKGFQARNRTRGIVQEVIALVEGDDEAVAEFRALVESLKPEQSKVSDVAFEKLEGEVMKTGDYAQVCTAVQLNKAIPILLDIRDDMKEMKGDMKAVRKNSDLIPQMSEDLKAVRETTDAARKTTDATLEEIKGMREDIQPGYAMSFRQMQSDIRAIKERLGMP